AQTVPLFEALGFIRPNATYPLVEGADKHLRAAGTIPHFVGYKEHVLEQGVAIGVDDSVFLRNPQPRSLKVLGAIVEVLVGEGVEDGDSAYSHLNGWLNDDTLVKS